MLGCCRFDAELKAVSVCVKKKPDVQFSFQIFSQDVQRYCIRCYIILYFGGNVFEIRIAPICVAEYLFECHVYWTVHHLDS